MDLKAYPTQSDIYMVQAQLLAVDWDLQCPTENGVLVTEESATDTCKKNQDFKTAVEGLRHSPSEDKRSQVKELLDAWGELFDIMGCGLQKDRMV